MINYVNFSKKKKIINFLLEIVFFFIITTSILATGQIVNLKRNTETIHYENGGYIEYILELENKTGIEQNNLQLKDTLFNSSGIEDISVQLIEKRGNNTSINIPNILNGGNNLIISGITLGYTPESGQGQTLTPAEQGYIKLKIKGKVKDNFSQDIISNAELTRTSDISETTSNSTLSRIVYDYNVTLRSLATTYASKDIVTYKLRLENNSLTETIKGLEISDNTINVLTNTLKQDGTIEQNEAYNFSGIFVTAVTSGVGSSYGDYPSPFTQGSSIENVVLGPKGVVEYTIMIPTNEKTVGDIGVVGTSGEKLVKVYESLRNNNEKSVDSLNKLSPKPSNISISKEKVTTSNYLPGDAIEYNIVISNTGDGYGYGYNLVDNLGIIKTNLASVIGPTTSADDVASGNAFVSGNITLNEKGLNSYSSNYQVGVSQSTLNLNDNIYVGPGESLTYNVVAQTDKAAIGNINNQSTLNNGVDNNTSNLVVNTPENLNVSDVTIEKTVGITQYEPDTNVVYTITVKNNDSSKFVNNYNIVDNITNILTTQAGGIQGQAFDKWTLNVVSPQASSNGTKVGTSILGSETTDNIDIMVDIAPGEEIIYQLVAHVSPTSVGDILDNTSSGLDNVVETGNGIKSYPSQLGISKTVDKTEYSPNEVLTYNVIIENKGKGYDIDVKVKDLISKIKDENGVGTNDAFKSWRITSSFEPMDTGINPSGYSGIVNEPLVNQDLDVTARIGARTRLIYNIQATVNGMACGKIRNIASINDQLYSDKGCFPINPNITATITSDYPSYPKLGEDLSAPFYITYTLRVSNAATAGFAKDVGISDVLSSVSTTSLNGTSMSNLFESWDISTTTYGDGTSFKNNIYPLTNSTNDINDVVNITADGYVEYVIKAKVRRDTTDLTGSKIPYEDITNSVTITPKDKTGSTMPVIKTSYTTNKKLPALRVEKSTPNLSYVLGGQVEYFIKIENIGGGYANNATISDTLSTNFKSWTIDKIVPSTFVGTNADINGTILANKDIFGTIDIAPKETVTYKITGIVKDSLLDDTITNIVTVEDTQRNNTYEASVKLIESTPLGLYMKKHAEQFTYNPGGQIDYTVTLYNTTSLPLDFKLLNYQFIDKFSEIKSNLANDKGGTTNDLIQDNPFKKIFVSINGGVETEITNLGTDFIHQPILPAASNGNPGEFAYKFRAILKDRVLSGELINKAVVKKNSTEIALTSHEIKGYNEGDYTREVDKKKYIPGEEITYTFTARGVKGYLNNYDVSEDIKNIQVKLLDGTTGNLFSTDNGIPKFTVERYVNGVLDGIPQSSGTVTKSVSPNENIVQTIDVSPNDTVVYKVKGTIRKDIVGPIEYKGLITTPYRHNLSVKATIEEGGYIPGEEITLKTTIENNSDGNAGSVTLKDIISNLELELSDGTLGELFPNGWTITTEKLGINSSYINEGIFSDNTDINTIIGVPIGGKLIYKITGIVNELAIGKTVNEVIVDGDKVAANVKSLTHNVIVSKKVIGYYKNDEKTEVTGGYVPNGWIKYKITLNNIGSGIANNITVSDDLASIMTNAYESDGTLKTISAYKNWKILSYEQTGNTNQSNINLVQGTEALGNVSLKWIMDIPSNGSITINILANVSEGAIGDIRNSVDVENRKYNSETSTSLSGNPTLIKRAYEIDKTTVKKTYISGERIIYKVIVENTGEGIISGTLKDEISKINSSVKENGSNGTNPKEASFSTFTITATKTNDSISSDTITRIGSFEAQPIKRDVDINDVLILAPGAKIEFEIDAVTKDNIIGNVFNRAYFGSLSKGAIVREETPNINIEKKVIKVGSNIIAGGTNPIFYNPGDSIEYLITITNTGKGHKNNLRLTENIDKIQAKIAGNTLGLAFENYNFQVVDSGDSYIRRIGLTTIMDIAPGKANDPEVVTIKVIGKLKDNVIGEIDENVVTYDNKTAISEKLQQRTPEIKYYKSFTNSSGDEISQKDFFAPEETIFYKLIIENTGNGYANNLSVIDKIYDLTTSNNDKAFKDGKVNVNIKISDGTNIIDGTNDGKTYVMGDISGSSLIDSVIDLAPNSKVEFYITGQTNPFVTGSLTNTIKVSGEGNPEIKSGKSDNVTTVSHPSVIVGRKIAGTDPNVVDVYYNPNGDLTYKVIFENNGLGVGIIYLKDIVSDLKVTGPGGNLINAFQPGYKFQLKIEKGNAFYPSNSNTEINIGSSAININGDLDTDIKLGSNSICSFTLTGKANMQAVGSIRNVATYKINSPTGADIDILDTIEPKPGIIGITNVANILNYTPGSPVTYTLTIKNTGEGYASDVNVEDLLSTMESETSGNTGLGLVFSSIDNVTTAIGANSAPIGTGTTSNGYQGKFDIAPGESVVINLTGTVNDNILGEIINDPVVTYNGQKLKAPVSLTTVLPNLLIKTEISEDGITYGETPVNYIPNEKLYYKVTLSNRGQGWDNNVNLLNIIDQIVAITSDTTSKLAFDSNSIIITLESGNHVIYDPNLNKLEANIDIAPGEDVVFKIEGRVNSNVIGEIKLDSKFENSNGLVTTLVSNEVLATQRNASLSVLEKIKNPLTGKFDLDDSNYIPGEEVTFKVFITNLEDTFAKNIDVNNLLTSMEVTLADGTKGEAFTEWSILEEKPSKLESILSNTIINGSDLNSNGNLAPNDSYAFIITARVNPNSVGKIENKSSYTLNGGNSNDSNKITFTPKTNKIEMIKSTDNLSYFPNGAINYKVRIKNIGDSIVDNIVFEDEVNKIKSLLSDGTLGDPIDISTIQANIISGETVIGNNPSILVDSTSGKVYTNSFDIGIGEKITFEIKGIVNSNIIGEIRNKARYIDDGNTIESNETVIESEKANIIVTKEALVDPKYNGYIPNQKIKYKISIENKGQGFGDNINIVDDVSGITVETNNGKEQAFSLNDWIWTKDAESLPNLIPDLTSFTGKNLNINIDIESGKTLVLYVEGTVNPNASGDITNTVTSYNGIQTSSSSATFKPSRSEVVMTHIVDKDVYEPGEELIYTVTLENKGPGPARNVKFKDNLKDIILETTNNDEAAFELSSIAIISSKLTSGVIESIPLNIKDGLLNSIIKKIPKDGKATYVFKAKLRDNAVGRVINSAEFEYTDNNGIYKSGNIRVNTNPTNAKITILKTVDKEEYIAGEDLTYNIVLKNIGTGNAKNIELTDKLLGIQTKYIDGTIGPVLDSWIIKHIIKKNSNLTTDVTTVGSYTSTSDLDKLIIDMAPSDIVEFKIVGKTNPKVKEGAINTASFKYKNNDGSLEEEEAKTKQSKPLLNQGELLLTKVAMKKEIQQGGFVEYEIIVRNVGKTYFANFFIEDKIPSGFKYVEKTTEMIRNGLDGTFGTNDDVVIIKQPVVGRTVNFAPVNLSPGESLRIRYLLKVSIGTTFGKYKNTAYAMIDGNLVSNEDSAVVIVIPDDLFDTATIIGKVFEDINGDGYQGLATASNIKIIGGITKDYIPNTLTLEKNNNKVKLNEKVYSLEKGVVVDRLYGISKNRIIQTNEKAILRFLSKSKDWSDIKISTKSGTEILINSKGTIKTNYIKDKKKGLSQENLHITRNTYKHKNKKEYLHEIVIENIGVYEEGIPGVRLIVLDGIVIETDEFGRYHVPDRWVLDKKGENFLIKVDTFSIPKGMELLTENPLVRRISPNGLNKFNFSLRQKEGR